MKKETIKVSSVKPEKKLALSQSDARVTILSNDTVYILSSDLVINNGQQLLIEEGTLIKVGERDITNLLAVDLAKGSILVKPGGILSANGTEENPIVFTSNQTEGAQKQNWGGITIEGKSTNNDLNTAADTNDYSGIIKFCRVEFAPVTLKSVGDRTIIENLMVSYTNLNGKPSISIIGGTFNAKKIISFAASSAADFFISNGYTGKLQYIFALRHPFFGTTSNNPANSLCGIFLQNNKNNPLNATPVTFPLISNLTIIGPAKQNGTLVDYESNSIRAAAIVTTGSACFDIRNSIFSGYPKNGWYLDNYETAKAIHEKIAGISNSFFHSNDSTRIFYLLPGSYPPFQNTDFKKFMLSPEQNNHQIKEFSTISYLAPFNYKNPQINTSNIQIINNALFENKFSNTFFSKDKFCGAVGLIDWTKKWTNFTPLTTNYNFPE